MHHFLLLSSMVLIPINFKLKLIWTYYLVLGSRIGSKPTLTVIVTVAFAVIDISKVIIAIIKDFQMIYRLNFILGLLEY